MFDFATRVGTITEAETNAHSAELRQSLFITLTTENRLLLFRCAGHCYSLNNEGTHQFQIEKWLNNSIIIRATRKYSFNGVNSSPPSFKLCVTTLKLIGWKMRNEKYRL